jgi:hypothetical protein
VAEALRHRPLAPPILVAARVLVGEVPAAQVLAVVRLALRLAVVFLEQPLAVARPS